MDDELTGLRARRVDTLRWAQRTLAWLLLPSVTACAAGQLPPGATIDPPSDKRGYVLLGARADVPIDYVELCKELQCLNVGPFEAPSEVYIVSLAPGRWCPSYVGLGPQLGVFDPTSSEACFVVTAREISYVGHWHIARGEDAVHSNDVSGGTETVWERVGQPALHQPLSHPASAVWVSATLATIGGSWRWAVQRYPDIQRFRVPRGSTSSF